MRGDSQSCLASKMIWFYFTLFGAAIPVLMRVLIWSGSTENDYFKDLLFLSFALSLSNLTLVGHKEFDERSGIILISVFMITIMAFGIGAFSYQEAIDDRNPVMLMPLKMTVGIFIVLSALLSYKTNKYIIATLNP